MTRQSPTGRVLYDHEKSTPGTVVLDDEQAAETAAPAEQASIPASEAEQAEQAGEPVVLESEDGPTDTGAQEPAPLEESADGSETAGAEAQDEQQ